MAAPIVRPPTGCRPRAPLAAHQRGPLLAASPRRVVATRGGRRRSRSSRRESAARRSRPSSEARRRTRREGRFARAAPRRVSPPTSRKETPAPRLLHSKVSGMLKSGASSVCALRSVLPWFQTRLAPCARASADSVHSDTPTAESCTVSRGALTGKDSLTPCWVYCGNSGKKLGERRCRPPPTVSSQHFITGD